MSKTDPGFHQADSSNLPEVSEWMLVQFFKRDSFLNPEMKNVKALRSGRASYGDNAIGKCQLKKVRNTVEIRAVITPEHRIGSKPYKLSCLIDQKEKKIEYARCESCVAKADSCKHSVAFVFWLERKAKEPPVTSVLSYWNRPILATCAGKCVKITKAIKSQLKEEPPEELANEFFKEANELFRKSTTNIIAEVRQLDVTKSLALNHLMLSFKTSVEHEEDHTVKLFLYYCSLEMNDADCRSIAHQTTAQAGSPLWFDMRFGRISGSKVYDASRNQTSDGGTLVKSILGAIKIKQSDAMKRGLRVEPEVLKVVAKKYSPTLRLNRIGFVMNKAHPIFGASPDALLGEYVVEVKCPISAESYEKYFRNNKREPALKYSGQMHLQMYMCKKKKALFCVASPDFEKTKQVKIIEIRFDQKFFDSMMQQTKAFWMKYIFKVLNQY